MFLDPDVRELSREWCSNDYLPKEWVFNFSSQVLLYCTSYISKTKTLTQYLEQCVRQSYSVLGVIAPQHHPHLGRANDLDMDHDLQGSDSVGQTLHSQEAQQHQVRQSERQEK